MAKQMQANTHKFSRIKFKQQLNNKMAGKWGKTFERKLSLDVVATDKTALGVCD